MNILVLCTGNSCRSQMAEGFLKQYLGTEHKVYSAGVETHGLNQDAVKSMAEIGIDISKNTSNHIDEYSAINFDYVITVCDHAREQCPILVGPMKRFHRSFSDPAQATGSEEQIIDEFRRVRDQIKAFAREWIASISRSEEDPK